MARVTGIGGVFFRASDPDMLAKWYEEHLGINVVPKDYGTTPWQQEAGPTVFAPFPGDTDYFGSSRQQWMLNLRVDDLDGMAVRLAAAGVEIQVDPEVFPNGRFARMIDPEGNHVELWEPA